MWRQQDMDTSAWKRPGNLHQDERLLAGRKQNELENGRWWDQMMRLKPDQFFFMLRICLNEEEDDEEEEEGSRALLSFCRWAGADSAGCPHESGPPGGRQPRMKGQDSVRQWSGRQRRTARRRPAQSADRRPESCGWSRSAGNCCPRRYRLAQGQTRWKAGCCTCNNRTAVLDSEPSSKCTLYR